MTYYGAQNLAASFRTVRKNTIALAEEIPADKYGFRAAPGVRSVAEQLAHIAVQTRWQIRVHEEGVTFIDFERFGRELARSAAEEELLTTKDEILAALRKDGEEFAAFLDRFTEERLGEIVGFPPPVQPATKSRFELLLGVKEHEMHHRAQLMLTQRLLGIVPHLTRQREAMAAQASGGGA
jgi:uncharacterized damage-inducible protein DinB